VPGSAAVLAEVPDRRPLRREDLNLPHELVHN
jgi:hypothetical protein